MGISRRLLLAQGAAAAAAPLVGAFPFVAQGAPAAESDLRFRCLWKGSAIGEHHVSFRPEGNRLRVETHVDIVAKFLFLTVFSLKHHGQEVWESGRLLSLNSTTQSQGTRLQLVGEAVAEGFRIIGKDGPFLADGRLMTSDALWDSRIVRESRVIDVQHGGEVGLVVKPLGETQVATPQGPRRASRYQMITPYVAGSLFYDDDQNWVKALVEYKGETLEYVLAT